MTTFRDVAKHDISRYAVFCAGIVGITWAYPSPWLALLGMIAIALPLFDIHMELTPQEEEDGQTNRPK